MLLESPQTTFAQLFTETVLKCEAVGNPEPLITWFKDGLEIAGATLKTLVIGEVDLSDRGAYHCTAENSQGHVTSDLAYLNILGEQPTLLTACEKGLKIFSLFQCRAGSVRSFSPVSGR